MRTLYAKASVERRREYRQLTLIQEENGKRFVRKTAENPDAAAHLKSYRKNYEALAAAMKPGSRIRPVPCEEQEDGSVIFPFLTAETLTDRLNTCDADGYIREAKDFRNALAEAFGEEPFEADDAFRAFFTDDSQSEISLPEGLTALGITNLDMNFDNVFLGEDGEYILIDYEWMPPFRVPAVYILYRSLLSDAAYARFGEEDRNRIRAALGLDDVPEESLWRMEMCFQRYAAADEDKLDYFTPKGGKALAETVPFDALAGERAQRIKLEKDLEEYKAAYDRQREEFTASYEKLKAEYTAENERVKAEYTAANEKLKAEYLADHEKQQEAIRTLNGERDEFRRAFEEYSEAYRKQGEMLAECQKQLEKANADYEQYRSEISGLWWYKAFYRNRKDDKA